MKHHGCLAFFGWRWASSFFSFSTFSAFSSFSSFSSFSAFSSFSSFSTFNAFSKVSSQLGDSHSCEPDRVTEAKQNGKTGSGRIQPAPTPKYDKFGDTISPTTYRYKSK